jgi:hypothetical protein
VSRARAAARRVAGGAGTGILELRRLRPRLAQLEEGVAESAALDRALTEQVRGLELSVAEVARAFQGRRDRD